MPDRTAHLVGSVNLADADSTFRIVSDSLGQSLPRLPDGEVGERYYWIQFQRARFDATAGLERVGDTPFYIRDQFDGRPFRLAEGVDATELEFPPLGYAEAAIASYSDFARLQKAGVIAATVRFQVALPTPAGVVGSFFVASDRAEVEPVYAAAIFAEVEAILAAIPHDRLAIQWDTALEFGFLEGAEIRGNRMVPWFGQSHDEILAGIVERAAHQASVIPIDVEVGYHLCYGDVEEHHFVEPADATMLAEVLSGIFSAVERPIDWVHLPVPIDRDDPAYFAPLSFVEWPERTDIYLGLLHHEDGVDGALRRAAVAASVVPIFGVATECGFGRGPRERTTSLLDLHVAVLAAL
jgi:methionine synthase II (cobalamin-independent)